MGVRCVLCKENGAGFGDKGGKRGYIRKCSRPLHSGRSVAVEECGDGLKKPRILHSPLGVGG